MLNLILWLVVGALTGWLANYGMHNRVGAQFDIMIGMVGALIGGLLIGYSLVNWNVFSPTALLVASYSAVVLLVIVKLMRTYSASTHRLGPLHRTGVYCSTRMVCRVVR